MDLLLILGIFSGIGNVIECLFSGILALICLIPVGIICLVAGYIFAKVMEFLIYMFW